MTVLGGGLVEGHGEKIKLFRLFSSVESADKFPN